MVLLTSCSSGTDTDLDTNPDPDPADDTGTDTGESGDTHYFPAGAIWTSDISEAAPDADSDQIITWLDNAGFGFGRLQIDFSIIAPLLFTADEVAAGEIAHAIRFILPNSNMRAGVYVRPATHAGGPSGPSSAPPYGVRLRLRSDYPLDTLPNDGARVVARALQKYGMFLADGGNVALTAQADTASTAKWSGLLGSRDLDTIQPADFEVMEMGDPIALTYDCVREP